jgi:hypothetical protein
VSVSRFANGGALAADHVNCKTALATAIRASVKACRSVGGAASRGGLICRTRNEEGRHQPTTGLNTQLAFSLMLRAKVAANSAAFSMRLLTRPGLAASMFGNDALRTS